MLTEQERNELNEANRQTIVNRHDIEELKTRMDGPSIIPIIRDLAIIVAMVLLSISILIVWFEGAKR